MWSPGETPEERAARQEAYERLLAAARRAGLSLDRLHNAIGQVARNETETRQFLADEVYNVPDDLLDDLVRIRLTELTAPEDEESDKR